ncbi:MAG: CHAT domain-containing protein [Bacteroidota bacterium]
MSQLTIRPLGWTLLLFVSLGWTMACMVSSPSIPTNSFQCGQHIFPTAPDSLPDCLGDILPDSMTSERTFLAFLEDTKHLGNVLPDSINAILGQLSKLSPANHYLAKAMFLKHYAVAINATNQQHTIELLQEAETLLKAHQRTLCDSLEYAFINSYLSYYYDNDHGNGDMAKWHNQVASDGLAAVGFTKALALEYANAASLCNKYGAANAAKPLLDQAMCIWRALGMTGNQELYVYTHLIHSAAIAQHQSALNLYYNRQLGQAKNLFESAMNDMLQVLEMPELQRLDKEHFATAYISTATSIANMYQTNHRLLPTSPSPTLFDQALKIIAQQSGVVEQENQLKLFPSLAFLLAKNGQLERADSLLSIGMQSAFIQQYADSSIHFDPVNILDNLDYARGLAATALIAAMKYQQHPTPLLLETQWQVNQQLITFLDQAANDLSDEAAQLQFAEQTHFFYAQATAHLIRLAQQLDQSDAREVAFRIVDKQKSRILQQAISNNWQRSQLPANHPLAKILSKERRFQQQLRQLKERFYRSPNTLPDVELAIIRDSILLIGRQFQQFKTDIAKGNRQRQRYALTQQEAPAVSTAEIQTNWLDTQTAVITYSAGFDAAHAFVLTKNNLAIVPLQIDSALLTNSRLFQEALGEKLAYFPVEGFDLYHQLLAPILPMIDTQEIQNLVIVPSPILSNISFPALVTQAPTKPYQIDYNELRFFIEDYTISYLPTLSLYPYLQGTTSKTASSTLAANCYAYIANPTNRKVLPNNLMTAINQIDTATQRMMHTYFDPTHLYLNALKSDFQSSAEQADLLHLALHGSYQPTDNFTDTYLAFLPSATDNGQLLLNDIYGMDLRAELAFLASCNAGRGNIYQSEGAISLERAFLYAGCRGTIAAVNPVEDGSAASLMTRFYYYLNVKELPIHQALAEAQRDFLRADSLDAAQKHPANWANYRYSGISMFSPSTTANREAKVQ